MLVLFDIDGTLLRSRGVGLRAMQAALEAIHPPRQEGDVHDVSTVDTAGRLDPLIWREMLGQRNLDPTDEGHDLFRRTYCEHLARMIEAEQPVVGLRGAAEAVAWVRDRPDLIAALLTGNYEETGRLKVRAAGIDPDDFAFGVWGCEAATRRGLPPIGIERAVAHAGRPIDPSTAVIVGDTPADIDCARAAGCRVIAVATGRFTEEELTDHHPDAVLPDLSDLAAFKSAIRHCLRDARA
ncbi:MAG: HAD family hydrolase [Planctomycetota bacterium]|nr:HAD family hydrolase [Planctomycetota bacterium]